MHFTHTFSSRLADSASGLKWTLNWFLCFHVRSGPLWYPVVPASFAGKTVPAPSSAVPALPCVKFQCVLDDFLGLYLSLVWIHPLTDTSLIIYCIFITSSIMVGPVIQPRLSLHMCLNHSWSSHVLLIPESSDQVKTDKQKNPLWFLLELLRLSTSAVFPIPGRGKSLHWSKTI